MNAPEFRIESSQPIAWSLANIRMIPGSLMRDCNLAVAIAAKSFTEPPGGVVRVVHVPSGEIVFSKISGWGDLSGE
jgi:hypothetical protein